MISADGKTGKITGEYKAHSTSVAKYRPILNASHLIREKSHAYGAGVIFDGYEFTVVDTMRYKHDGHVTEQKGGATVWDGSEEPPSIHTEEYTEQAEGAMATIGLSEEWQDRLFLGIQPEERFDKENIKPIAEEDAGQSPRQGLARKGSKPAPGSAAPRRRAKA